MIRLQLLLRFSPLSWSDGGARNRGKAGEIESARGGREAKELQQKQQGVDERVLVGWGQVYLALQIAPSSGRCV